MSLLPKRDEILAWLLSIFGLIVYNDEMAEYYDYPENDNTTCHEKH